MKNTRLFLTACLMVLAGFSFAQTTVNVPSGGDLLEAYNTTEGDVILVLEDGGVYENNDNFDINKSLTIKAADGAAVRPVVKFSSTYFMEGVQNDAPRGEVIKLQGIELTGSKDNNYIMRFFKQDSIAYIEFTDVLVFGVDRSIIRASEKSEQSIDSIVVENCHFAECGRAQNYPAFYMREGCDVKYVKVTNTTIDGFGKEFIEAKNKNGAIRVIVDQCNIHRTDDTSDQPIFDIDGDTIVSSITISNSIISNIQQKEFWSISDNVVDSVMNTYFWDVQNDSSATSNDWSYDQAGAGFTKNDPMFSHDSVGAYYLDPASPAMTANAGEPIGDPRWVATPALAGLFNLSLDAGPYLVPSFDTDVLSYTADIPWKWGDTVNVIAGANYKDATIDGDGILSLVTGDAGTATVVVTGTDASTKTYTLAVTRIPASTDATLASLLVRSVTDTFDLEPVFDPATLGYILNLPAGNDTIIIEAEKNEGNATISAPDTVFLTAENPSQLVSIIVRAQDEVTSNTYEIDMQVCGTGTDASLLTLTVGGTTIEEFDPGTLTYDVELDAGTTDAPLIDALPTDDDAAMVITQAPDVNGSATVDVTATDCETTATYTVNFSVGSGTGINDVSLETLNLYPNPVTNSFTLSTSTDVKYVDIYNVVGEKVLTQNVTSANGEYTINVTELSAGIYLIHANDENNAVGIGKFSKQQ